MNNNVSLLALGLGILVVAIPSLRSVALSIIIGKSVYDIIRDLETTQTKPTSGYGKCRVKIG